MKMKIWIEEAMKEMVEEVEKNEPMPKHWKRNVLLFCLLSAVCFQTGLLVLAKNGIASADRSPLFIAIILLQMIKYKSLYHITHKIMIDFMCNSFLVNILIH